jgi:hypothetical protein
VGDEEVMSEQLIFNERTMDKVFVAMLMAGLDETESSDLVNSLQNEGILFRERA